MYWTIVLPRSVAPLELKVPSGLLRLARAIIPFHLILSLNIKICLKNFYYSNIQTFSHLFHFACIAMKPFNDDVISYHLKACISKRPVSSGWHLVLACQPEETDSLNGISSKSWENEPFFTIKSQWAVIFKENFHRITGNFI